MFSSSFASHLLRLTLLRAHMCRVYTERKRHASLEKEGEDRDLPDLLRVAMCVQQFGNNNNERREFFMLGVARAISFTEKQKLLSEFQRWNFLSNEKTPQEHETTQFRSFTCLSKQKKSWFMSCHGTLAHTSESLDLREMLAMCV